MPASPNRVHNTTSHRVPARPPRSGTKTCEGDRDQPPDAVVGQAGRGPEGVQAVAGEFAGRHVRADGTRSRGILDQPGDEVEQMLLGLREMIMAVQLTKTWCIEKLVRMSSPGRRSDSSEPSERLPRWVKILVIVLAVLVAGVVAHQLIRGGGHDVGALW
jgi:hypothetical protein